MLRILTKERSYMGSKVLFISEEQLKNESNIESNVDAKVLSKTIQTVQETDLKAILGLELYNGLVDAVHDNVVSGSTLSSLYSELLHGYVKPFLLYKSVSHFLVVNNYKITNKGTMKLGDNSATNVSSDELEYLKNYYDNYAVTYKEALIEFLRANNLLTSKSDTDTTSVSIGWFLGKYPTKKKENIVSSLPSSADVSTPVQTFDGTLRKVLLVSEQQVKTETNIETNVDAKVLSKTIQAVQDIDLKAILGLNLYVKVLEAVYQFQVNSVPINSLYTDLINNYIKPFLVNRVVSKYLVINNYKITNKGLMKLNDNSASNLSSQELEAVRKEYENDSITYKKNLIDYLRANKFGVGDDDTTSTSIGWFLGGHSHFVANSSSLVPPSTESDPIWEDEKGDYYTKPEVDDLIAGVDITETDPVWESEKENYYQKTEVDGLIDAIEETDPVWNSEKGNYYTKTEVDGLVDGIDYTPFEEISNKGIANGYTPLNSSGKVDESFLPDAVLGATKFKGFWNASANTITSSDLTINGSSIPASSSLNEGWYFIVTVAGSTNESGITDWNLGDWIISIGTAWKKVDNTDAIITFNNRTGAITLLSSDVTSALGYTPYNATNPNGYINGITSSMILSALGYTPYNATNPNGYISAVTSSMITTALGYTPVTNARTITINGTTYDLSANRSWTIVPTSGTRLTRVGISAPSTGQQFYQTDELEGMYVYDGEMWVWQVPANIDYWENFTDGLTGSMFANSSFGGTSSRMSGTATIATGINLDTGTGTSNWAGIINQQGTTFHYPGYNLKKFIWCGRVNIPILSDATNTFTVYVGCVGNTSGTGGGAFFTYTHGTNSGKWVANYRSVGNVLSTLNSTVTVDTTKLHSLVIVGSVANSNYSFYVDGVSVGTITPSGGNLILLNQTSGNSTATGAASIIKSAGSTVRQLFVEEQFFIRKQNI